jgi:predicted MPP superfamily phosphohydrolase
MFRIAHLSDLHLEQDFHQDRVIKALVDDLGRLHAANKLDAIVFSGDAAAKGKTDKEQIEAIVARFVSVIREVVGVEVPFLICPGNHDVDLKSRPAFLDPVFNGIISPEKANELVKQADAPEAKALWAHMDGFRSLAAAIDGDAFSANPFYYTKKIAHDKGTIGFACLNSAWMTRGGGNADYGKLYVGEHVLDQARKELDGADIRIAVMHHPLDWLAPEEKSKIQRYLTLNFHGYLCGHKHDNTAETLSSTIGTLLTSNTGCVYQSLEFFNGYSIVEVDRNSCKWTLSAREYYHQRDVFDVATRFAERGQWEAPLLLSGAGTQIAISGDLIRAVNDRANSLLLSYASDIAPKSIGAIFVEPPLSTMSEKELIAKSKGEPVPKGAYESLLALGQRSESIFFIGKREAGKTLLLHHIAVDNYQLFNGAARIGVVVDLNALHRFTEAAILEQMVEFCGGEIVRGSIIKLLQAGEMVVCFDNVKIEELRGINLIRDFVTKYSRARYLFAASEELLNGFSATAFPNFGFPLLRIYVHSFRARHTKELVGRWFGSNDLILNQRILDINRLFERLRVPRTPFLVSVLSWVLEQRPNANVLNRASAIEVLIEGLLGKFNESKARKGIDSTIQQHFLSEFALHLNEVDSDWINRLDFEGFVVDYFKKRGLTVSTDGFAADLVSKGLIFTGDDRAGFKFDCFRAFFLAKKFAEHPELWEAALEPNAIARYVMELDLFTGLHRDRAEVLRMAKTLCRQTFEALEMNFPVDEIDRMGIDGLILNKRVLSSVGKKLRSGEVIGAEPIDESPDLVSADHDEARKRRHIPDMGAIGRYLESLRAFSMILRNSELVSDVELKRESFEFALEQWANTTIAVILGAVEQVEAMDVSTKAGVTESMDDGKMELKAFTKAMITQMIISIMCDSLASPKMELFVREKTGDAKTLIRLLAVVLAFEAGDDTATELGKALLKDHRNNAYVLEVLFFKLLGTYLLNGAGYNNPRLRDFLGDIVVRLQGGTIQNSAVLKSSFLGNIDKSVLVKEFRQNSAD